MKVLKFTAAGRTYFLDLRDYPDAHRCEIADLTREEINKSFHMPEGAPKVRFLEPLKRVGL